MTFFIDSHRDDYGVEPIRRVLPIAPSTYYEVKAREADESRLPARAARDAQLREQIRRVWEENFRCTAFARSGASFAARASRSPAARWRG